MTRRIDPLEKIVRPIVEGQIRGFLKEHPKVLDGVDWYAPRTDKAVTFTNSLAKRIVRDLVCASSQVRIKAVLLERSTGAPSRPVCGPATADGNGLSGTTAGQAIPPSKRRTPESQQC